MFRLAPALRRKREQERQQGVDNFHPAWFQEKKERMAQQLSYVDRANLESGVKQVQDAETGDHSGRSSFGLPNFK